MFPSERTNTVELLPALAIVTQDCTGVRALVSLKSGEPWHRRQSGQDCDSTALPLVEGIKMCPEKLVGRPPSLLLQRSCRRPFLQKGIEPGIVRQGILAGRAIPLLLHTKAEAMRRQTQSWIHFAVMRGEAECVWVGPACRSWPWDGSNYCRKERENACMETPKSTLESFVFLGGLMYYNLIRHKPVWE